LVTMKKLSHTSRRNLSKRDLSTSLKRVGSNLAFITS
jgi:hypothetical protein